ncbi:hypothetical protein B0H14DRAFT_1386575 [Mycena olivaceomarginata]|nr:hypothetical protein B0H14DRAFT_1386575 [Mycena olivaceomarginata]
MARSKSMLPLCSVSLHSKLSIAACRPNGCLPVNSSVNALTVKSQIVKPHNCVSRFHSHPTFGIHPKTELDSQTSRASEQRPIATLQDVQGLAIIQLQGVQAAGYTLFTSILNNEGGLWRGITQYLSVISRVPFASSPFNSVNLSRFPSPFSPVAVGWSPCKR